MRQQTPFPSLAGPEARTSRAPGAIGSRQVGTRGPSSEELSLWLAEHGDVVVPRRPSHGNGMAAAATVTFTSGAGPMRTAVDNWQACAFGTIVALRTEFTAAAASSIVSAIRLAVRRGGGLLAVHAGAGGTSLLSTLCREDRRVRSLDIEVAQTPRAMETAGVLAAVPPAGFSDIAIDERGQPRGTYWRRVTAPSAPPPLRRGEAVLITGGLGGLGKAVALHLSRRFGVHPVIVDNACAESASARAALGELHRAGRPFTHVAADVTDAAAMTRALRSMPAAPPVTAIIHCAGLVEGGRVRTLTAQDILRLSAPKVAGLRSVLAAVDVRRLRIVLAFGSILARLPHSGVGAYALANELMRREIDRLAARRPGPRYLTAEWSIWDGAGAAAETGAVAVARRAGYAPVRLPDGLQMVERLLAWRGSATSVVVSARPPLSGEKAIRTRLLADVSPGGSP